MQFFRLINWNQEEGERGREWKKEGNKMKKIHSELSWNRDFYGELCKSIKNIAKIPKINHKDSSPRLHSFYPEHHIICTKNYHDKIFIEDKQYGRE